MAKGDLAMLLGGGSDEGDKPDEDPRKAAAQSLIDAVKSGDVDAVLMAFDDLGGGMPSSYDVEIEDEEDEG